MSWKGGSRLLVVPALHPCWLRPRWHASFSLRSERQEALAGLPLSRWEQTVSRPRPLWPQQAFRGSGHLAEAGFSECGKLV